MSLQTQQLQKIHSEELLEQNQLKQTMQQDFLNIMGIAQDVQDALNYYKDYSENIVKIQFNRLILQHNLSSAIHYDLHLNAGNQQNFLNTQRQRMNALLNEQKLKFDSEIQTYLDKYQKNCLSENPILITEKPQHVDIKPQFNEQVVSKLINGMQEVDKINNEIKQGKEVHSIQKKDVDKFLISRSEQNQKKLLKQKQIKVVQIQQSACCSIF